MERLNSFKAYDVRGKVPSELNPEMAYKIGRAYAKYLRPEKIVIGYDIRSSSEALSESLAKGLTDSGVNVVNIGLCGTEMVYFATPALEADGGIMITASHNPPEYNGMKFVRESSIPVGYSSGLNEVERIVLQEDFDKLSDYPGKLKEQDVTSGFIESLRKFYKAENIKGYKVVCNAGNGCAGLILDELEKELPVTMYKIFNDPNSEFPNGVPNPLLPENRQPTVDAIMKNKADLGVAWDGDYDRCFFFDEKGRFIEGYYIVGLLAKSILKEYKGEKIVHDPRLIWNTLDIVKAEGGTPVQSVSGHAYIKEKMRAVNAIYGGEMSAHHYFRDNSYADSGMIPFLLILELMSKEEKPLSELVEEMIQRYPCSGEINSTIENPAEKLKQLEALYPDGTKDLTDGLSVEYPDWRFNVRLSNTEPIIRLNVESRGDIQLMEEKTKELLQIIRG